MTNSETEVPLQVCRRILRKTGYRASTSACTVLRQAMAEYAEILSREAKALTTHRGARTISGEDILLAIELLEE